MEDFCKVNHRVGVNFQMHLPSVWFIDQVYHRGVYKDLQNNNSDTYFFAYKIKTNYFMAKQKSCMNI